MRILVAGSRKHLTESERANFADAGAQLGSTAVSHGHKVLVETDSENTIDRYVGEGAAAMGSEDPMVEIHRMMGRRRVFAHLDDDKLNRIRYHKVPSREYSRLGARVGALNSCDVVILIGGDDGTTEIARLARDLRKPLVAIASFDGAAAEVYNQQEILYLQRPELASRVVCLADKWKPNHADSVIKFCEVLAARHTYFLSYAHQGKDIRIADHVETLLLRRGRTLFRDERELDFAKPMQDKISSLIRAADTFLLLWSAQSESRQWCSWERKVAVRSKAAGPRPKRICFLLLDNTPLPTGFESVLHPDAKTRAARGHSIIQLIEQECA